MALLLEALVFVLGIIYGYVSPGRENRSMLLQKGLAIGIVLAIILVGVGLFVGGGLTIMTLSGVAVVIEVVILTVLFIIGTWIGDWLEGRSTKSRVTKVSH